ncbi:metallophosphoesterase [Vibrio sp. D431a]|uniref:metallophosphoesterase n=1 Tax=Vibrio sp. D431a TaxID=2837388 RepID=UPI002555E3BA|nr:metallophosphoesterase [Vibrio sp. D431a]
MIIDVVQDIHARATDLEKTLRSLGYTKKGDCWSSRRRKMLFLGDYIDGGSENRETINIIREMVENNAAFAICGNHELNAIAFATVNPETGDYYRKHTASNLKQHNKFLEEFPFGSDEHREVIQWFKSLPLFVEFEHFYAVHACWCNDSIDLVKAKLPCNDLSDESRLDEALTEGTELYRAIDKILKGVEVELPDGVTYKDGYGKTRSKARLKWWEVPFAESLVDCVASIPLEAKQQLKGLPKPSSFYFPQPIKPVFCGHYKIEEQMNWSGRVMCLDIYGDNSEGLCVYSLINQNHPMLGYLSFSGVKTGKDFGVTQLAGCLGKISDTLISNGIDKRGGLVVDEASNVLMAQRSAIKDLRGALRHMSINITCTCKMNHCAECEDLRKIKTALDNSAVFEYL